MHLLCSFQGRNTTRPSFITNFQCSQYRDRCHGSHGYQHSQNIATLLPCSSSKCFDIFL